MRTSASWPESTTDSAGHDDGMDHVRVGWRDRVGSRVQISEWQSLGFRNNRRSFAGFQNGGRYTFLADGRTC